MAVESMASGFFERVLACSIIPIYITARMA